MKNILSVVALMSVAGGAFAATTFNAGTATTRSADTKTYTYTVTATPLFVQNDFDFTVSANVVVNAIEDPNGRYMVVGGTNTGGRNIYTVSSDGGSVTGCGTPLTAAAAKVTGALQAALASRLVVTSDGGCTP